MELQVSRPHTPTATQTTRAKGVALDPEHVAVAVDVADVYLRRMRFSSFRRRLSMFVSLRSRECAGRFYCN